MLALLLAASQVVTVGRLLERCERTETARECDVYILGVISGAVAAQAQMQSEGISARPLFCPTTEPYSDSVNLRVLTYLRARHGSYDRPAFPLIVRALREAYPCVRP